jgi:nitrite reductase/ring-hydroxylating ferredoxin subunit
LSATRVVVRDLDALGELDSVAVDLPDGAQAFVVRYKGALYAYKNVCPHWGVDLDLGFGDFVDRRAGRIFCRNHAAEFLCDTGLCVSGPCRSRVLEAITLVAEDGAHVLELSKTDT